MLATKHNAKTQTAPVSVRFEREELEILERISKRYPVQSKTNMIRAAVRSWGSLAENGLDANLQPLKKGA